MYGIIQKIKLKILLNTTIIKKIFSLYFLHKRDDEFLNMINRIIISSK